MQSRVCWQTDNLFGPPDKIFTASHDELPRATRRSLQRSSRARRRCEASTLGPFSCSKPGWSACLPIIPMLVTQNALASCEPIQVCDRVERLPLMSGLVCDQYCINVHAQTPQPWSYVSGNPYGEYLLMEAAAVRLRKNLLRASSICCPPNNGRVPRCFPSEDGLRATSCRCKARCSLTS